jgi:hypothetical protein
MLSHNQQVGVLNDVITNAENIVAKGRLGPGQMVVADLQVRDASNHFSFLDCFVVAATTSISRSESSGWGKALCGTAAAVAIAWQENISLLTASWSLEAWQRRDACPWLMSFLMRTCMSCTW